MTRSFAALLLLCAAAVACAPPALHRLYAGPQRPHAEVAVLQERGTTLIQIDGRALCNRAASPRCDYELLPGPHALSAHWGGMYAYSLQPQSAAFVAEAGRVYEVRGETSKGPDGKTQWLLVIVDTASGKKVQSNW